MENLDKKNHFALWKDVLWHVLSQNNLKTNKMKTLKLIAAIAGIISATASSAQETGSIKGFLTDEKGANMPFVSVALIDEAKIIESTTTDDNGAFTFKALTPGVYDLQFSFVGYKPKKIKEVKVEGNQTSRITKSLQPDITMIEGVEVISEQWEKPVFNTEFTTVSKLNIDQIEHIAAPKNNPVALITAISSYAMETTDGKDIYMRGSRRGTTSYYVDGNKIIGEADVPGLAISGMEVLAGGVPAEYGDCTGGLVIITTKDYKTEMRRKRIKNTERKEREVSSASFTDVNEE